MMMMMMMMRQEKQRQQAPDKNHRQWSASSFRTPSPLPFKLPSKIFFPQLDFVINLSLQKILFYERNLAEQRERELLQRRCVQFVHSVALVAL
jgi:type VI protein secretion system component VasK